jgi:hypothetical protein
MEKVFISSTCYDLIDLRVEIEKKIEELGLIPLLSDSLISEFTVSPDINSIENCLTNVRNSDYFIIILSQRYGPSLIDAGYGDISATHLEYLEAKKMKKPILMYVRDRLETDYTIWKKNKEKKMNLSLVKEGDEKIFDLLKKHKSLLSTSQNNWCWTFRDSLELKERISKDFKIHSKKALLRKLIDEGKTAHLIPNVEKWHIDREARLLNITFHITNVGLRAAINPWITLYGLSSLEEMKTLKCILPGDSTTISFKIELTADEIKKMSDEFNFGVEFRYSTPEGHYMGDDFSIDLYEYSSYVLFTEKTYCHSSDFEIKTE